MLDKEIQTSIELGVDLMKDIVAAGYNFLKKEHQRYDTFGSATRMYIGGLIERYNNVKVLGMHEPVPLKNLYVRANILEKITARMGIRLEDLEKFFDRDRRTFGEPEEVVDGEIIVNKLDKFIVLGKPGAGKTTYLKYLTLMMLDPNSQIEQRKLPIFVTLREFADSKSTLIDFIVEQFDICGFEAARPFIERILKEGNCLILFDGLDEVSQESDQNGIIQHIKNFTDKHRRNQIVISCRLAAYNYWFDHFTDVEMADFNQKQMELFIRNWFKNQPKVAFDCWERLEKSPQLRELGAVPLLLTLLCIEYEENNEFPPNRAELYERAIETLLAKWDASRRIRRDEIYKNLSTKRKETMFTRIAYGTFTEDMYFIPERILTQQIKKYIEHLSDVQGEELEIDSKTVLKSIEAQHGIFVERAKGIHSFAHLTFQEYFTAKYIVDNSAHGMLESLVNNHFNDDKWLEIFLLVAEMLNNADEFLLLMRQKNDRLLNLHVVNDLMQLVEDSLFKEENENPSFQTKSSILFRTLDLALDNARARINALDRAIDFAQNFNSDRARALITTLKYAKLEAYSKENKITTEIADKIAEYLKGNVWIMKCLESDAFISKHVREKILNEMLMPGKKGE